MLKKIRTEDYVGQNFPDVGWYGKNRLLFLRVLMVKSTIGIWINLENFFLIHFITNISSTTQPHKIPAKNLRNMQFSPRLFLHGFCPVFQHAEIKKHTLDYVR